MNPDRNSLYPITAVIVLVGIAGRRMKARERSPCVALRRFMLSLLLVLRPFRRLGSFGSFLLARTRRTKVPDDFDEPLDELSEYME